MRRIISALILAVSSLIGHAQQTYFPYPTPPESLTTLNERTNYLVEHFWDRCDLKGAFSARAKLAGAFNDYVSFMPYADADVVHKSIDRLIKEVKKDPSHLLALGEMAEDALYGDSAELISDEAYLPFAKAVAECKKIPGEQRARFEHQARVLAQSQTGQIFPALQLTLADGTTQMVRDITTPYIVVFINDPDCIDCRMARARLVSNYDAQRLIASGTLAIVSVYPDAADDLWRGSLSDYPQSWIVGASADVDDMLDTRTSPTFYFLDSEKKIVAKNIPVDNIINAMALMPDRQQAIVPEKVTEIQVVEDTQE